MLAMSEELLVSTFDQLRSCGAGRRECVAYWVARKTAPDALARVAHPVHTAVGGGYEVDGDWVMQFFVALRNSQETVRVQIHTHPREAGHSWTDDAYALVPAEGFFSLVIPNFAQGPVGLEGAHLVEMTADGRWSERRPEDVFRLV